MEVRCLATLQEVRDFLLHFKIAMTQHRGSIFEYRDKNLASLAKLGMLLGDAQEIIRSLTPEDYCQGPLDDNRGGPHKWWVFGPVREGVQFYIKLALISPKQVRCKSFHEAEAPLERPYQSYEERGGE